MNGAEHATATGSLGHSDVLPVVGAGVLLVEGNGACPVNVKAPLHLEPSLQVTSCRACFFSNSLGSEGITCDTLLSAMPMAPGQCARAIPIRLRLGCVEGWRTDGEASRAERATTQQLEHDLKAPWLQQSRSVR